MFSFLSFFFSLIRLRSLFPQQTSGMFEGRLLLSLAAHTQHDGEGRGWGCRIQIPVGIGTDTKVENTTHTLKTHADTTTPIPVGIGTDIRVKNTTNTH